MMKVTLVILSLVFSTNVFATSPVDFDQVAFKVLMANAPTMNVVGDIEANRLSDLLAETLYNYNNESVTLQVYNRCVLSEGGELYICQLSIVDSDGEGESALILFYQLRFNSETGEAQINPTANSRVAG